MPDLQAEANRLVNSVLDDVNGKALPSVTTKPLPPLRCDTPSKNDLTPAQLNKPLPPVGHSTWTNGLSTSSNTDGNNKTDLRAAVNKADSEISADERLSKDDMSPKSLPLRPIIHENIDGSSDLDGTPGNHNNDALENRPLDGTKDDRSDSVVKLVLSQLESDQQGTEDGRDQG